MTSRIFFTLLVFMSCTANSAVPKVVVSINPIHALVSGVMKGVGQPTLLLSGHESGHHFSLTPSKAEAISGADLFIWVGPAMETVLQEPVTKLATNGRVLTLLDLSDLQKLELETGKIDPHIWLDPKNAKVIVKHVATMLSGMDPSHAGVYESNASQIQIKLDQLDNKLVQDLASCKDKPYFVYHDAFQYFEKAFGLQRSVPVVKDAEHSVRASQRVLIEKVAKERSVRCIFGEPDHGEKIVKSLAEQLNLHVDVLDPMGVDDPVSLDGPYYEMMEGIAFTLKSCLLREK